MWYLKKKKLLCMVFIMSFFILLIGSSAIFAAPADPTPYNVTQANGTIITIRTFGDEYFHWTEEYTGDINNVPYYGNEYVIAFNNETKNWCYARIENKRIRNLFRKSKARTFSHCG